MSSSARCLRSTLVAHREHVSYRKNSRARSGSPPLQQASDTIATLTDDWDQLDGGQRRQVLATIFSELVLDEGRLVSATPRPGWLDSITRTGVLYETPAFWVGRRRRESNPR